MMEKMVGIAHYQGRVAPVFDVARNFLMVRFKDGREEGREETTLQPDNPFHRAQEVRTLGVDVVVCGAISHSLETMLRAAGIHVTGFVCGPPSDETVQTVHLSTYCALLAGNPVPLPVILYGRVRRAMYISACMMVGLMKRRE
jgi:predicted Fe-Mo cluster-binding NifX family protein